MKIFNNTRDKIDYLPSFKEGNVEYARIEIHELK